MSKKLLLGALLVSSTMALATNTPELSSTPWDLKDRWNTASFKTKIGIVSSSTALAFMAMSLYHLMLNEPKTDFKAKGEWKKLLNFKLLAHSPKEYWENLYNVYWYLWIGQYFKDNKLKLNSDGDPKMSKKKLDHGIVGKGYTHLWAAKKATGIFGDIAAVLPTIFAFCFAAEKLGILGFGKSKGESVQQQQDRAIINELKNCVVDIKETQENLTNNIETTNEILKNRQAQPKKTTKKKSQGRTSSKGSGTELSGSEIGEKF